MTGLKTRPTKSSADAFIRELLDQDRRADCLALVELMKRVTGQAPKMWGPGMVGFGSYHYKYESGREGDWFLTGFAPRKANLVVYVMAGFDGYDEIMGRLGKYKTGKSCLYLKRLADVDEAVLEELVAASVVHMRTIYGE